MSEIVLFGFLNELWGILTFFGLVAFLTGLSYIPDLLKRRKNNS